MIKKTLPLCLVLVMMVAGMTQAAEWPTKSWTITTTTWGDVTYDRFNLDQVGSDVTTGGNTRAADGTSDWVCNFGQWPRPYAYQYYPGTGYANYYVGQMAPQEYAFQMSSWGVNDPDLIHEIDVAEGWYNVFAVYNAYGPDYDLTFSGVWASTSETGPLTACNFDSGETIDVAPNDPPTWTAKMTKVGTVYGTTLLLRVSDDDENGGSPFAIMELHGMAYQPAFKEIIVEPTAFELTEGDAAGTVTVTLTHQPASDVTITVTPGVHGMDYALNAADPNDPVDLVFTAADWAAKTLTITPVDDVLIEDYREEDQLALSITTSDPCYASRVLPAIDVDIIDNEAAYEPTTYPVNTQTWGDITVHHADLDQVGNDITPGGNTRAANGVENWLSDFSQWPRQYSYQWYVATGYATPFEGQMDPAPYAFQMSSWGVNEPELITEVEVAEGTYDIFVLYTSNVNSGDTLSNGIYGSTSETGPLTPFTFNAGESVDEATGNPDVRVMVAHVGQVTGTTLRLRISNEDENRANPFGITEYFGMAYRLAPWKVTESSGSTEVSENGATDTIEFELMVEPASDVTVDLAFDAAQLTVSPAQLVFPVASWDTPQSVTVGAVDDAVLEADPHSSVVTYASDSADPNDALAGSVAVSIGENDCGAWGYYSMDFDQDCDVDMADLAAFAAQYLLCTRPDDPACTDLR